MATSGATIDERGIVLACPACGRRNRVPFGRAGKCGQCHAPLPDVAAPIDAPSAGAFDALIRSSPLPVIVDFWAPWCGPCRMVAPEIARVASDRAGEWIVVKVNTEELPDLGQRFGIQSIPTMALFRGGREVNRTMGARPAADIRRWVSESLG